MVDVDDRWCEQPRAAVSPWKVDVDAGAGVLLAVDLDLPAVFADDPAHDEQPKAGPEDFVVR